MVAKNLTGRSLGAATLAGAVLWMGCGITDVSRGGAEPEIVAAKRADAGLPAEMVLCSSLGGTLALTGKFAPLPIGVLTEAQSLVLPAVVAAGNGVEQALANVTYRPEAGTLEVRVGANELAVGTYDLRVINPNGKLTTLPGALTIVPPPTITAITPASGSNATTTAVKVSGTGLRATADGTLPQVSLVLLEPFVVTNLTDVTLLSPNEVDATVAVNMPVAIYDVTVTNPDGCSATLPQSFDIGPPIDLCSTVTPSFGWVYGQTTVEICASAAHNRGLKPVPQVFLIIGGEEIPLVHEAYLNAGSPTTMSVMSAVVPSASEDARIVVGGPYALKVVNPDGAGAVLPNAFSVLADEPPHITAVTPARGDANATNTALTVIGEHFKAGNLPNSTNRVLTLALARKDTSGTVVEIPCGRTTVVMNSPSAGLSMASCTMTLPGAGTYLVRVRHEDDHAFADFASYSITSSGRKLASATTPQEQLNTKRRAHGTATGEDDLGNRFLYVAGGENADGVLASVEVASVSKFGELSAWSTGRAALPQPRTGLTLAAVGRNLYAIGGSSDGSQPLATDPVLRADILGSDTVPSIDAVSAGTGGSLAAGVYYYRVAAIMKDGTSNPLGETLPSDLETVRVAANGSVTLSFAGAQPTLVHHFVIYRSATPNEVAGGELLLATTADGSVGTYTDDGTVTPSGARPLARGSTGVWVVVAASGGSPTITPRFDHASTVLSLDATHAFVYVAGGRLGPSPADVVGSVEIAALVSDGATPASWTLASWSAAPAMPEARAEHVLVPVGPEQASALATLPKAYAVMALGGTQNTRALATSGADPTVNLRAGRIDATAGVTLGNVIDWQAAGAEDTRVGLTAVVTNDFCYVFNGRFGNPNSTKSPGPATRGTPDYPLFSGNFSSATMSLDPGLTYRSGLVLSAGYFFFVGGSADANPNSASSVVLRGGY